MPGACQCANAVHRALEHNRGASPLIFNKNQYMVLSLLLLSLNRQWTADGLLLFKSRVVGFGSELTTNSTGESGLCYVPAD